jgi:hypothetical protein
MGSSKAKLFFGALCLAYGIFIFISPEWLGDMSRHYTGIGISLLNAILYFGSYAPAILFTGGGSVFLFLGVSEKLKEKKEGDETFCVFLLLFVNFK